MIRKVFSVVGGLALRSRYLFTACSSFQAVLMRSTSKWSIPSPNIPSRPYVCTSPTVRGLEEFFPQKDDIIEEGEQTGRSWTASELRQKSYEDLHKLWYILLKERNMLLTLKNDARRYGFIMPAPERLHKVAQSMARIKFVLHERTRAISMAKQELGLAPPEEGEVKESKTLKTSQKKRRRKWNQYN